MKAELKPIVKFIAAASLIAIGFYLMLISTMGPEFTALWEGQADFLIRMAMLVSGFTMILVALVWLIWSLLKLVVDKLN